MYAYVLPRISLPDKCIKALDKWVENLTKEENQKENDNESK